MQLVKSLDLQQLLSFCLNILYVWLPACYSVQHVSYTNKSNTCEIIKMFFLVSFKWLLFAQIY